MADKPKPPACIAEAIEDEIIVTNGTWSSESIARAVWDALLAEGQVCFDTYKGMRSEPLHSDPSYLIIALDGIPVDA